MIIMFIVLSIHKPQTNIHRRTDLRFAMVKQNAQITRRMHCSDRQVHTPTSIARKMCSKVI